MTYIDQETGQVLTSPPIRNANPWTRVRVAKHFSGASLAKQSFQKECDINTIMRKYEKSGLIEHLNTNQGQYGNYIGFEDYHSSLNQILAADAAFLTIPSRIRAKFNNDPGVFLEFAQNPENHEEMVELGLATQKPSEASTGDSIKTEGVRTPEVITAAEAALAAAKAAAIPEPAV